MPRGRSCRIVSVGNGFGHPLGLVAVACGVTGGIGDADEVAASVNGSEKLISYSKFFKFPLVFLSSSFLASLQIFQIQYPLPTLQKEYQEKKHQNFHFLL